MGRGSAGTGWWDGRGSGENRKGAERPWDDGLGVGRRRNRKGEQGGYTKVGWDVGGMGWGEYMSAMGRGSIGYGPRRALVPRLARGRVPDVLASHVDPSVLASQDH